jgi:hypothetical protein
VSFTSGVSPRKAALTDEWEQTLERINEEGERIKVYSRRRSGTAWRE